VAHTRRVVHCRGNVLTPQGVATITRICHG
jgi:hypothetical protein